MRCRQCDYPLWNLTEPRCPECGAGFDLRTYRFTPGHVAFGCPHCGALHGGTGPSYLPSENDAATCQSCGQLMSVPQMRVVPLSDDAEGASAGANLPWEQRGAIGWFRAWYRTCFMAMTSPGELGRELARGVSFGSAYWFAAITMLIASVAGAIYTATCFGMLAAMGPQSGALSQQDIDELMMQTIGQVALIPLVLLAPLLTAGITGGLAHLFLKATGDTRSGFHLTAVSTLFGQGPLLLALIPACGSYVTGVWALIASILILRAAQGVGGVRATFAMLAAPIVVLLLLLFIVALMVALG